MGWWCRWCPCCEREAINRYAVTGTGVGQAWRWVEASRVCRVGQRTATRIHGSLHPMTPNTKIQGPIRHARTETRRPGEAAMVPGDHWPSPASGTRLPCCCIHAFMCPSITAEPQGTHRQRRARIQTFTIQNSYTTLEQGYVEPYSPRGNVATHRFNCQKIHMPLPTDVLPDHKSTPLSICFDAGLDLDFDIMLKIQCLTNYLHESPKAHDFAFSESRFNCSISCHFHESLMLLCLPSKLQRTLYEAQCPTPARFTTLLDLVVETTR